MQEMDEFESKLRQAFVRRPAPPGLKRRIMEQRNRRRSEQLHRRVVLWQRLAAVLVLAACSGRRTDLASCGRAAQGRGSAGEQVMTALRITNHALDQIQARLAARDRTDHE